MLLFLTLGLLAVCLAHLSFLRKSDIYLYCSFFVILVVMAFQDAISTDFPQYIDEFEAMLDGRMHASLFRSRAERLDSTEAGWFLLNYGLGSLIPSFHAVAFVALGFYCLTLIKLIRTVVPDTYRWLAIAYFYLGPILFNMSGIRQTVAIGFFIMAVCRFLETDSFWRALVWILLGALFHNSILFAIVLFPLVFLKKGEGKSIYVYEGVFALLFIVASFSGAKYQEALFEMSNTFFAENADSYATYLNEVKDMSYSLKSLIRLAFPLGFAMLALPVADRKEFTFLVYLIVGQILSAFFGFEGSLQRMSLYCTVFAIPSFMIIANHIKVNWLRYTFCAGTIILNAYLFWVMLKDVQYSSYLNYHTIFF